MGQAESCCGKRRTEVSGIPDGIWGPSWAIQAPALAPFPRRFWGGASPLRWEHAGLTQEIPPRMRVPCLPGHCLLLPTVSLPPPPSTPQLPCIFHFTSASLDDVDVQCLSCECATEHLLRLNFFRGCAEFVTFLPEQQEMFIIKHRVWVNSTSFEVCSTSPLFSTVSRHVAASPTSPATHMPDGPLGCISFHSGPAEADSSFAAVAGDGHRRQPVVSHRRQGCPGMKTSPTRPVCYRTKQLPASDDARACHAWLLRLLALATNPRPPPHPHSVTNLPAWLPANAVCPPLAARRLALLDSGPLFVPL